MKYTLQTYVLNPRSTASGVILGNSGDFKKWGLNGRSWVTDDGSLKVIVSPCPGLLCCEQPLLHVFTTKN